MNYPEELTKTYDIYEKIGAGGGGVVYRAIHKRLNKEVVLKKLKGSAGSLLESRTEVDILKNLRHSYLPQVLDFIECSEGIFTVMDFIPGKSLQKMLDERHKFTEKEVLKYAKQLCEALDYLHSQKQPIIHGDIKPDNIMITPEGNVCLIDFNISGVFEGKGAQTVGYTPGFSSPEQIEAFQKLQKQLKQIGNAKKEVAASSEQTVLLGSAEQTVLLGQDDSDVTVLLDVAQQEAAVSKVEESRTIKTSAILTDNCIDKRSDVYSLGATLYTLLTGQILKPDSKSKNIELTSEGLVAILNKALQVKPEKRYADAGEMRQAFLNVHKKDKKYRQLLIKQEISLLALFLVIAVSVFLCVEGRRVQTQEKQDKYHALVEQMSNTTDEQNFENLFEEATILYPNYLDAYYEKICYYYDTKGTEETIAYIDSVLLLSAESSNEMFRNLYHIYAECYFKLENYENAKFYYEKALYYLDDNPDIYRDYAISLVYLNHADEAKKVLEKAIGMGMVQADIYMVQGELERLEGNTDVALTCFENVLQETTDAYLRQRAYVIASYTYEAIGTTEALQNDTEWLETAVKELEAQDRLLVYERLVKEYIALGEQTQENGYYAEAIRVLEEIIAMQWDTVQTYANCMILCQRMGDLERAAVFGEQMENRYAEHYMTYLRQSYLEIELQKQKSNKERDYSAFEQYYEKAKECYAEQVSGNVTNTEMQLLDNLYEELISGGWLE